MNASATHDNYHQAELDKFAALANRWWDRDGPQRALHVLNPVRLDYVKQRVAAPGLQGLEVLDVGCGGGLLSEALARAGAQVTAIDLAPKVDGGKAPPGMVVLLSDGTNTAGQAPLQAAADAAKRNVPVYTIAYGTDNGYVDLDGKRERVAPDKLLMTQIAQETKGKAYTADNVSQLDDAYKSIQTAVGFTETEKEITATAAGVGLALALLAAVGAVMVGARWP